MKISGKRICGASPTEEGGGVVQSMVQGMHCGKRFVPKKNVASKVSGGESSL